MKGDLEREDQTVANLLSQEEPQVSIVIISYNGMKVIAECLESIFTQTYTGFEVLVVDNASTDGTPDWVRTHYPQVKVLDYPTNGGPNPARNLGIRHASHSLILLVDDDAILKEDCLASLIHAVQQHPEGSIWAPRLIFHEQRDTLQHEGAYIHYLSAAILVNGSKKVKDGFQKVTQVSTTSGTCFLLKKEAAESIGLFDEDYFFGRTDGEFGFRLTLAGHKLYSVPEAVAYHRVKKRGLSKAFYQIRNRWYFTLITYSWRTLILSIPALLVYEIALIFFLLIKGALGDYLMAMVQVFAHLPKILKKRKQFQAHKVISDREVLRSDPMDIRSDLVDNKVFLVFKTLLDRFFNAYWNLIYRFV